MLMLLLLVACSSCSDDDSTQPLQPGEKPVLKLYIFSPDNPIVTRASGDHVKSETDAEKKINTLQVWVFKNNTNDLVSYVKLEFNEEQSIFDEKVVLMDLTEDFVVNKTEVDIFVAANVTQDNCGLSFDKNTTATTLQNAKIGSGYFGIGSTSKVTAVPTGGLPMTGRLKMQALTGTSPVFGIGNQNVKLVRAVSKVRFVFCKSSSNPPDVQKLSVSFDADKLPKAEYLFLANLYNSYNYYRIDNSEYEPETPLVTDFNGTTIEKCSDPVKYVYDATKHNGQQYEDLINLGINGDDTSNPTKPKELTEVGRYYLRESDKQLSGKIAYTIGTGSSETHKEVGFSMPTPLDFTRNHTWIVYGYFMGSGNLMLHLVETKSWTEDPENRTIYNW